MKNTLYFALFYFYTIIPLYSKENISLNYIQERTILNLGIDDYKLKTFLKRSQYKNALPELKFSINRGISKVINISEESYNFNTEIKDDNDLGFEASLSWDLSQLLFNVDSLRVIQKIEDISILKRNLLEDVTKLYFEREKLIKNGSDTIEIKEVTARINIVCGNCIK